MNKYFRFSLTSDVKGLTSRIKFFISEELRVEGGDTEFQSGSYDSYILDSISNPNSFETRSKVKNDAWVKYFESYLTFST